MNRASLLQRMSTDTEWRSSCFLLQFPTEDLPCFPYLHALTNSLFLFSFLFSRLCSCQLSCFSQPSTSPAFSNLLPSVFYPLSLCGSPLAFYLYRSPLNPQTSVLSSIFAAQGAAPMLLCKLRKNAACMRVSFFFLFKKKELLIYQRKTAQNPACEKQNKEYFLPYTASKPIALKRKCPRTYPKTWRLQPSHPPLTT